AAAPAAAMAGKKKIVFVAGGPSHGFFAHDHLAGCKLLADRLNAAGGYDATVYFKDWPKPDAFDGAAAVVVYADGGGGHIAIPHQDELKALSAKGVGVGMIHYAVEVPKEKAGPAWLDLTGGYFETFLSVNPHWLGQFNELTKHPVTNGVKPFQTNDEWYYHMRFREGMAGVRPILSAVPPDATRKGKDDAHGGNPEVRAGIGKSLVEHVMWVSENDPKAAAADAGKPAPAGAVASRGFGCTGGHFHKNWANDEFRKTVLNAIVWIAQGEVPPAGIESKRPDVDELLTNRDPGAKNEQPPANFDKAKLAEEIAEMNKPYAPPPVVKPAAARAAPRPGDELLVAK
ncbi:MAG: hypothetical protein JWO31_1869, partial [Phycisphaerales bacterium]|nr:hypothetical protein [Phycisphaerales bacterium]